jgi:hypothetical protein
MTFRNVTVQRNYSRNEAATNPLKLTALTVSSVSSFQASNTLFGKKRECVVKTHDRNETFVLQGNQNIVNYH